MGPDQAKAVTELITIGQFTHDFPITVERAKAVGLPVSTEMPESVYRLMDLYSQRGALRPSANYVPLHRKPQQIQQRSS